MKDNDLASNMSKFIDCPYSLGDTSKGWDCLSFILDLYEGVGIKWPDEYNGITRENYGDLWKSGGGRKEFEEFLLSLGESVTLSDLRRGDLIIFKKRDGVVAPSIYTGNQNMHIITDMGGKTVPFKILKLLKFELIDIRRLL